MEVFLVLSNLTQEEKEYYDKYFLNFIKQSQWT